MDEKLQQVRARLNRPLPMAEKLLLSHLDDVDEADLRPGDSYINLRPDRVAHQDVTGQMAILQFMQSGRSRVAVPTTVHCDHLIQARVGASSDLQDALNESNEVYQFLESACRRYGMGFWRPGSGIIHQVVLEKYAFPGSLILGTDSPHRERRRAGFPGYRRGWRGRRRCDGRPALGGPLPPDYRREAHRFHERMDGP